ncbi:MAG: hypothetical protein ACP5O4_07920 [bacterium]
MIISSFKNTFFINFYSSIKDYSLKSIKDKIDKEYKKYKVDGIILLDYINIYNLINKNLYIKAGYDLYNIDLTRAEVSGNGLACLAKFINYNLKFYKNFYKIEFNFYNISFNKQFLLEYKDNSYFVGFDSSNFEFIKNILENSYYVNVANPHVIYLFNNFYKNIIDFSNLKSIVIFLKDFYKKVYKKLGFESNVHLVHNKGSDFYIYSYERGVGFTKSCGSGSIATFYLLNKLNLVKNDNFILKSLGGNISLYKKDNFYYLISNPRILIKK